MSFLSKRASNTLYERGKCGHARNFNSRLFNTNLQPQRIEILMIEKFMVEEFKVEKSGVIHIRGENHNYLCQQLFIPRGLSSAVLKFDQNFHKFTAMRRCRIDYVRTTSTSLRRYNKFLDHPLIDRIAQLSNDLWIIQSHFDIDNELIASDEYLEKIESYLLYEQFYCLKIF